MSSYAYKYRLFHHSITSIKFVLTLYTLAYHTMYWHKMGTKIFKFVPVDFRHIQLPQVLLLQFLNEYAYIFNVISLEECHIKYNVILYECGNIPTLAFLNNFQTTEYHIIYLHEPLVKS